MGSVVHADGCGCRCLAVEVDEHLHRVGVLHLGTRDDAAGLFAGPGAPTVGAIWRGEITATTRLGADLRVDLAPVRSLDESVIADQTLVADQNGAA